MRECPICNYAAADGDGFCKNCGLEFANPHGQSEAPAYGVPRPPDPQPPAPRPMTECPLCHRLAEAGVIICAFCGADRRLAPPIVNEPIPRAAYGVPRPIPGPGGIGIIVVIGILLAGLVAAVWFAIRR